MSWSIQWLILSQELLDAIALYARQRAAQYLSIRVFQAAPLPLELNELD